jgi:uncharacterized RDD family membrane protein YckC
MIQWYYADTRHARQGPVTPADLLQLREDGRVDDATLVWRDGLSDWMPLRELAHELGATAAPTAPAAPVAPAASASDAWALEPVTPPETDAGTVVTPDDGWRPLTEGAATPPGGVIPPDNRAGSSPYAPPAANVARPDTVVHGGEVVLAGFWKRVAAYLIDSVIVGIAGMIVGGVIGGVIGGLWHVSGAAGSTMLAVIQVVANLASLLITAAYYAWFHASQSMATPGKMAIGIKVVRTDGARISLPRSIGRYFATILSGLILGIGFLMAAFTERKQTLHDMICDTLVVDRWAFTDRPELQRRELGTVTVVVLAIGGILAGLVALAIVVAIGIAVLS